MQPSVHTFPQGIREALGIFHAALEHNTSQQKSLGNLWKF
jgi:hypothetical protein